MKLQVLGCAGGIGGRERLTTSLLLDDDVLLDAGTGLTALDIDRLIRIDHVFITHCHLDHVAGLAFLVDAVQGKRNKPVTVHATGQVIEVLKQHLFNWALWPDFAMIPRADKPSLCWEQIEPGTTRDLGGRKISPRPVNHNAGSVAYLVENSRAGFLFTGDMASTPELWGVLREKPHVDKVIVDCSFSNADRELAAISKHFCPSALIEEIRTMGREVEFLIYHLKPGQEELIMRELNADGGGRPFRALKCGELFEF